MEKSKQQEEWENELEKHNLSERRGEPEVVPVDILGKDSPFLGLSIDMQSNIIEYLKKIRDDGASVEQAKVKLKELVDKSVELSQMSSDDSDKIHKNIINTEVEPEIEEIIVENVEDLIKKLEDMRYKNSDSGKGWVN